MDIQMWGFIQKTKQTLGLPFKLARGRILKSSQAVVPPTPSKQQQNALIQEVLDEPQSRPDIPPLPPRHSRSTSVHNKSSDAHLRPPTDECHDSVASTPLDRQELEDSGDIPQVGAGFTSSPSRIIVSADGTTSYFALLLNENLVIKQRTIIEYCRKKNRLQGSLERAKSRIVLFESQLDFLNTARNEADDEAVMTQIQEDIENRSSTIQEALENQDALRWELELLELNLEYARNLSQEMFEQILGKAGLLNLPEVDDDSVSSIHTIPEPTHGSAASIRSSRNAISAEELFRRRLLEELEERGKILNIMETAFHERYNDLRIEQEKYDQAVLEGECDLPQSEFDRMALGTFQQRTRDYIEAEEDLNKAKSRARAFGLLGNESDQLEGFIDDSNDGYAESFEAAMMATVDEASIEAWKSQMVDSRVQYPIEPEELEQLERLGDPRERDAESVGMGDSLSCCDDGTYRSRIDRWNECGGNPEKYIIR